MHKTLAVIFVVLSAAALILPAQSLVITSPNGGETLTLGQAVQITWTANNVNQKVKLQLIRGGGALVGLIAGNLNATPGAFTWTVGQYQGGIAEAAGNYKIRILGSDSEDASNNAFNIVAGAGTPSPTPPAPPAGLNVGQGQSGLQMKPQKVTAQIVNYAVISSFTVNGQPQPGNTYLEVFRSQGLNCHTSVFSKTQPVLYRYTLKLENTLNNLRYLVYQGNWTEQRDFMLQLTQYQVLTKVYPDNMLDGHQVPIWLFGSISVEVKNATQSETPQQQRIDLKFWL